MPHDELELLDSIPDDELKLLDSIFELLKGSRDQTCQRVLFGLYECDDTIFERNQGDSAQRWFEQLCCAELREFYNRETASYSNNHAFTGLVNHQLNRTNKTLYLKYLKPALCEYGRDLVTEEQKHLLWLLEQGVELSAYWNDPELKSEGISRWSANIQIKSVAEETPERCQQAVFGYDGICNRFLQHEIERKGRATGAAKKEGRPQPKDTSHRKKTQTLPGPYRVLAKRYSWFVERVSRGYLDRCTDIKIFFGVLAAAFVLGLNLDEDAQINSRIKAYLRDLIGDSEDIQNFKLLLADFCAETKVTALPAYPPRLRRMLQAAMRGAWNAYDVNNLIRSQKKRTENEMDKIRNLYLEWLEARVECELLYKQLTQGNLDEFLRKSDLEECVQDMDNLKAEADGLLNRLLARETAAADSPREVPDREVYAIEF